MIQVTEATVKLTEQTVRELLSAVEEAKKITTFTNDPLPEGVMDTGTHTRFMRERGEIAVRSQYDNIEYQIEIEKRPHSQESLGYRLVLGSDVVRVGKDGRCLCKQSDKCPLGRSGSELRCTKEELEAAGIRCIS